MNEEENVPSQKEIKNAKAQQAGKDIADVAGKAAATYFGGAAGSKIYDVASKTKTGQRILAGAGKSLSKNPVTKNTLAQAQPMISKAKPVLDQAAGAVGGSAGNSVDAGEAKASSASNMISSSSLNLGKGGSKTDNSAGQDVNSSNSFNSSSNTKSSSADIIKTVKNVKKFLPIIGVVAFLLIIMVVIAIVSTKLSGLLYISDFFTETDEKMSNFFAGCGWSSDEECNLKHFNDFYNKVDDVYDDYKKKKGVTLNKELIVATLTYADPFNFNVESNENDGPSYAVDYKKSKKQVDKLAENMVRRVKDCYLYHKEEEIYVPVSCDYKMTTEDKKTYTWHVKYYYVLDEKKYRCYLEGSEKEECEVYKLDESFILKYYFNNNKTEQNKREVLDIVDEIYSRVEFIGSLNNQTSDSTIITNNIMVTVTDCTGNITLEQVTLEEYLQGVIHMYKGNSDSVEYMKYLAVVSKNYLYAVNGATKDSIPTNLRIRNCQLNQLYCNVKKGCHYMDGVGDENDTLMSGPNSSGHYIKAPINDVVATEQIKLIIEETMDEFVVSDGKIVKTQYSQDQMSDILAKLSTSDYKSVLADLYGGFIEEIEINATGYPLDYYNNRVTSLYGWRVRPKRRENQSLCGHHNGIDIAATKESNIYAYASGVVVYNGWYGEYGYHTEIGHGVYDETTGTYEYYTSYSHQIRLSRHVSVGDTVMAGAIIGNVGSTGTSTGNHLHFEIYTLENGVKVRTDPALYFKNVELTGLNVNTPLYESESACIMANS